MFQHPLEYCYITVVKRATTNVADRRAPTPCSGTPIILRCKRAILWRNASVERRRSPGTEQGSAGPRRVCKYYPNVTQQLLQTECNLCQQAQAVAKHTEQLDAQAALITNADETYRDNSAMIQKLQDPILQMGVEFCQLEAVINRRQHVQPPPGT